MSPHDLLKLNVNEHTEKKNGLTYLSWAWAWAEALKADSTASFIVHTFADKPYMDVNGTGMVWVTVTMFGQGRTCMLPVMNHRNQPIQSPDAFQVNTAIMRCMTKALALHGLGLYIYSGDDLPQSDDAPTTMGELTKRKMGRSTRRSLPRLRLSLSPRQFNPPSGIHRTRAVSSLPSQ